MSGSNGTFEEHCDEAGNLVEYACVVDYEWKCNDWECYNEPFQTGEVFAKPQDCAGTCKQGACASYCPEGNARVEFLEVNADATAIIEETASQKRYSCQYSYPFDRANEAQEWLGPATMNYRSTGLCIPGVPGIIQFLSETSDSGGMWSCTLL